MLIQIHEHIFIIDWYVCLEAFEWQLFEFHSQYSCSSDSNSEQIILENLPPVNVVIAIRNNVFFLLLPKKIHIFHSKFKKKRIKKQDFDRITFCLSVNLPVGRNEYV